jgi:protein-S-isoprenylcysteine O-methyltransferase Ste14
MPMAVAVLALEVLFAAAAFGLRTVVQWRRTGDTGWRLRSEANAAATFGRVALLIGLALAVAAPIGDLAGLARWSWLDHTSLAVTGLVLMAAGSAVTVWAQFAMGRSWRIGVDPDERTDLVTAGPFQWVRNPIYTAMLLTLVGLVLALPNVVALATLAASWVALEVQVRAVEEPYLLTTHPGEYATYLTRAGRFLPGIGRRAPA